EIVEGGVIVEIALDKFHALGEAFPHIFTEFRTGTGLRGLTHVVLEVILAPVAASVTHQGETRGQQTTVGQIIDRGEELLAGEVTGDTEDDQAGWSRDAGQSFVLGITQGIGPGGGIRVGAHGEASRSFLGDGETAGGLTWKTYEPPAVARQHVCWRNRITSGVLPWTPGARSRMPRISPRPHFPAPRRHRRDQHRAHSGG